MSLESTPLNLTQGSVITVDAGTFNREDIIIAFRDHHRYAGLTIVGWDQAMPLSNQRHELWSLFPTSTEPLAEITHFHGVLSLAQILSILVHGDFSHLQASLQTDFSHPINIKHYIR